MTIVGNVAANNGVELNVRSNTNTGDDSFARMLNEVSDRERTQNNQRNERNNGQERNVSAQNTGARPADERASTESRTQDTQAAVNEGADESYERPPLNAQACEEMTEEVAYALQITGQEVLAILASLEMQPADLAETKNVTVLISEVLEVESPIELLGKEGVKEMFAEISEAVTKAYEKTVPEPVQIQAEAAVAVNREVQIINYAENPKEIVNMQLGEEENFFQKPENENGQVKLPAAANQQQKANEANTEAGKEGNNQNELFQNAEVEVNYTAQPMTENRLSANTAQLNPETPQAAAAREVVDQIFEKIKVDIKPGVSEIKMSLRPASLGEVSLRIASENGIITAHFVAESQRVKEIIESSLNHLKDSLAEQGVNVSELSVSVSTGNSEQHMNEFLKERSKSQGRIADILASLENGEPVEIDEQEVYNNTLNIKA